MATVSGDLRESILRKCRESMATKEQFFTENAGRIAICAEAMARAFDQGGRLFVMGNGGSSCDAAHVSVEFMHPIIEKRPALPALALTTDTAMLTAVGNDQDFAIAFAQQGHRVLLIDCDLRRARIHKIFDDTSVPGLTSVLVGGESAAAAIRQTRVPGLNILPSGVRDSMTIFIR